MTISANPIPKRSAAKRAATAKFIKVSDSGLLLPAAARDWSGVYISAAQLIVARRPTAERFTFKAGNAACRKIDLCGAMAQRSISLREFINHLLDDGRTGPALDPKFFTIDDPYQWIWTCDECAPSGCAWFVYLSYGYSYRNYQSYEFHVLAVRAGQFSGSGEAA